MDTQEFQEIIWQKGNELFRPMPWREDTRPYYVLVSEIMLQQTQVERVIPKFEAFIDKFPSTKELAKASLADVLTMWSGLGYNRRAKFLHEAAQMIENEFGGTFPDALQELVKLPGVGVNTAGAIVAYSFNQPVSFIETNVRTVYFYQFHALASKKCTNFIARQPAKTPKEKKTSALMKNAGLLNTPKRTLGAKQCL